MHPCLWKKNKRAVGVYLLRLLFISSWAHPFVNPSLPSLDSTVTSYIIRSSFRMSSPQTPLPRPVNYPGNRITCVFTVNLTNHTSITARDEGGLCALGIGWN